jgi:hypothetical protein
MMAKFMEETKPIACDDNLLLANASRAAKVILAICVKMPLWNLCIFY